MVDMRGIDPLDNDYVYFHAQLRHNVDNKTTFEDVKLKKCDDNDFKKMNGDNVKYFKRNASLCLDEKALPVLKSSVYFSNINTILMI